MKKRSQVALLATVVWAGVVSFGAAGEEAVLADISHIHGIGFDRLNPGNILLATHNGLFRATPDGAVAAVSSDRNDYMGFTPDPADPNRLLASGHPSAGGNMGVIVSEDGGTTWAQVATGVDGPVDFHAMTISRADPRVIYGLYGNIQVSRDGGMTWSVAGQPPRQIIDLAAAPFAPDSLYAGAANGLFLSADAGRTWTLVGPSDVATTMVEVASDGAVFAYFHGAGLFRLADGRWSQLASDFGESYLLHLATDPSDPAHLVSVTEKSTVLESKDGGISWDSFGQ